MPNRPLTQYEWMLRCLMVYYGKSSYAEVFVVAHDKQNMPEGANAARFDCDRYEETGILAPYVEAQFLVEFPWNKIAENEPCAHVLAAE